MNWRNQNTTRGNMVTLNAPTSTGMDFSGEIKLHAKDIKSAIDQMLKQLPSTKTEGKSKSTGATKPKEFSLKEAKAICTAIRTSEMQQILDMVADGRQMICGNLNAAMRQTIRQRMLQGIEF